MQRLQAVPLPSSFADNEQREKELNGTQTHIIILLAGLGKDYNKTQSSTKAYAYTTAELLLQSHANSTLTIKIRTRVVIATVIQNTLRVFTFVLPLSFVFFRLCRTVDVGWLYSRTQLPLYAQREKKLQKNLNTCFYVHGRTHVSTHIIPHKTLPRGSVWSWPCVCVLTVQRCVCEHVPWPPLIDVIWITPF